MNEGVELNSENLNIVFDPDVELPIADRGKRFLNHLIDLGFIFFLGYFIGGILALLFPVFPGLAKIFLSLLSLGKSGEFFLGIMIMTIYFTLFEATFGLTVSKIFTKTKVVNLAGEKPSFLNVLGRTLCRFMPFEAFSFFSENAVGWHDKLSGTRVVELEEKRDILKPVILTSFILICSLLFMFEMESVFSKNSNSKTLLNVSFQGVSFDYPDNWSISTEEIDEGLSFQINCEKKGLNTSEVFSVIIINQEIDIYAWLENSIDIFKETSIYKDAFFGDIKESDFNEYDAFSLTFEGKILKEKFFGEILVFTDGYISILMLKQAGSIDNLKNEFEEMESSFTIELFDDEEDKNYYDYSKT